MRQLSTCTVHVGGEFELGVTYTVCMLVVVVVLVVSSRQVVICEQNAPLLISGYLGVYLRVGVVPHPLKKGFDIDSLGTQAMF